MQTPTARLLELLELLQTRPLTTGSEISDRLSISVGTVKIHLHHVYDKLGLTGRQDLVRWLSLKGY